MVLGVVGGFAGLLWSLLAFSLGEYERFSFQNTLIRDLYPTFSSEKEAHKNEVHARNSMMDSVKMLGNYEYSYWDYFCGRYGNRFCCCNCHNKKKIREMKVQQFQKANERLA